MLSQSCRYPAVFEIQSSKPSCDMPVRLEGHQTIETMKLQKALTLNPIPHLFFHPPPTGHASATSSPFLVKRRQTTWPILSRPLWNRPFKCAIKAIRSKCALGVPNMSAAKCQKSYISLYAQKGPEGFNWLCVKGVEEGWRNMMKMNTVHYQTNRAQWRS